MQYFLVNTRFAPLHEARKDDLQELSEGGFVTESEGLK